LLANLLQVLKTRRQHPLTGQRAANLRRDLGGDVGLLLMATWRAHFRLHVCCN